MQNFIRKLNSKFTFFLIIMVAILLAAILFHELLFEYFLVCFSVSLVFAWFFIFRPSVKALRNSNNALEALNSKLTQSNQKLSEEQKKTIENLDQIQHLHDDLAIKEHLYKRLIDSSDNMIYELDEYGRFIFVNPITEKITGFSKGDLHDKLLWELVHPNHKDAALQFYATQRKRKQEHSYYELPILSAKRKTIWIAQSMNMYFAEKDGLIKSSVISRDITDLKMTQVKLANSEKLYRLLSNNSRDLVSLYYYTNDLPFLTYVSPSVKNILGYAPEEFVSKGIFQIMLPEDAERIRNVSYPMLAQGISTKSQFRVYKRDRTLIWLEWHAEPFSENEKVIGFQTSARDITQRIENEAKINEAKEKAEQATRAKSQFLSMMSHEIRTPLNGIIGLTNFLLEDDPSPEQLKYLKLLKFSGDNLLTIINDVLDFSKIEANEIHLEHISFNLRDMLDNALQTLRIRATDKGLPLMFTYDPLLPEVLKGDPVRLSQIINNLVSNAIKFTENGYVSVQSLYAAHLANQYSVTFSVSDTGIGIPADKLDYIFESFTQATHDTARKFGGTGLGLSITRRLIQLMGSDITVTSKLGEGTEFTFSLQLEAANLKQASPEELPEATLPSQHIHILLVDDNEVNLIVAANYLRKWNFQVTTAGNGIEALDKIKLRTFNVVLMDLQMPEMDGYEASRIIRQLDDPYFTTVPILAFTASAMAEDIQRLSQVGINDYVAKPFNPNDLHKKVITYALPEVPGSGSTTSLLNEYSGDNPETKRVLAERMIDNLKEIHKALLESVDANDDHSYRKSLHKIQTTLSILNDQDFEQTTTGLKKLLSDRKALADKLLAETERFAGMTLACITELKKEL